MELGYLAAGDLAEVMQTRALLELPDRFEAVSSKSSRDGPHLHRQLAAASPS